MVNNSKICTGCKIQKPISDFAKNLRRPDGLQTACKNCRKNINKQWYQNNKKVRYLSNKRYREKIRQFLESAKNGPCVDCKNQYHSCAMDFDHISEKNLNISDMAQKGYSIETIKQEILKCELVCTVCHRLRTFNRKQNRK